MSSGSCEIETSETEAATKDTRVTNPVMVSDSVRYAKRDHDEMICASQVDEKEEADKVAVIVEANAVVHPGTVMI